MVSISLNQVIKW